MKSALLPTHPLAFYRNVIIPSTLTDSLLWHCYLQKEHNSSCWKLNDHSQSKTPRVLSPPDSRSHWTKMLFILHQEQLWAWDLQHIQKTCEFATLPLASLLCHSPNWNQTGYLISHVYPKFCLFMKSQHKVVILFVHFFPSHLRSYFALCCCGEHHEQKWLKGWKCLFHLTLSRKSPSLGEVSTGTQSRNL